MIKKEIAVTLQSDPCEDKENLCIELDQYMIFGQNLTNVVDFTNPTRKKHSLMV